MIKWNEMSHQQGNYARESGIKLQFTSIDEEFLSLQHIRNRKQTRYIYNLNCCPHVAIMFCSDFGGWGESTRKLLPKQFYNTVM